MQQVHAYKDGNRWIIAIEDTEKNIDDVVKGILAGLLTGNVSQEQNSIPSIKPEQETNTGGDRLHGNDQEKIEAPEFVKKIKAEASADGAPKESSFKKDDNLSQEEPNDAYTKAVDTLRRHKNSKVLIDKLQRRFGVTDVEEAIARCSKEEIISLFEKN